MTDLESTYTQWPNDVLEALASVMLPGEVTSIVFYTGRETFGYHRTTVLRSYGEIANAIGRDKRHVKRGCDKAVKLNILCVHPGTGGKQIFSINREISSWCSVPKKARSAPKGTEPCPQGHSNSARVGTHINKEKKDEKKRGLYRATFTDGNDYVQKASEAATSLHIANIQRLLDSGAIKWDEIPNSEKPLYRRT